MGTNASPAALFAGVDVSKDKLDLARSDRPDVQTYPNDPAGVAALVAALAGAGPALRAVVVESTGGLERPLLEALLDAGLPAALCGTSPGPWASGTRTTRSTPAS